MQFLYPTYLWGLFLIIIPIIIHLFQLRKYRLVYFSSLKFLKQIEIEQKRKSRLRELLLLIIRILMIVALVLAFAYPYFPSRINNLTNNQVVGLYVDNSLSMEDEAGGQTLFDHAKRSAIETAQSFPPETQFFLLHNDDRYSSNFPIEQKEIRNQIELLKPSGRGSDLGEIIDRFNRIIKSTDSNSNSNLFLFSDFQESFIDISNFPDSLVFATTLVKLPEGKANNIFIDSCWFTGPVQNTEKRHTLHASINNHSDRILSQFPVHLLINDSLVGQETVDMEPYSSKDLEFSYTIEKGGWLEGKIEIRDYPVSFDNIFHFTYHISETVPVLQIYSGEANSHLRTLFDSDQYFEYAEQEEKAIPYQDLHRFQLVILNGPDEIDENLSALLRSYVEQGGNLLVIPDSDIDQSSVNRFLTDFDAPLITRMLERPTEARIGPATESFYRDISLNPSQQVEWPLFRQYFLLSDRNNTSDLILKSNTNTAILARKKHKTGYISVFASPLDDDFTNFHLHPLFIPFLYYIANTGLEDNNLFFRMGQLVPASVEIDYRPEKGPVKIVGSDGDFELIPNQFRDPISGRLNLHIAEYSGPAGIVELDRSGELSGLLAINYPGRESVLNFISSGDLQKLIEESGLSNISIRNSGETGEDPGAIKIRNRNFSLIRILLLWALILLFVESLIHRYKT